MKGIEGQLSLVELSHRALVRSVSRDDYFFFFFCQDTSFETHVPITC